MQHYPAAGYPSGQGLGIAGPPAPGQTRLSAPYHQSPPNGMPHGPSYPSYQQDPAGYHRPAAPQFTSPEQQQSYPVCFLISLSVLLIYLPVPSLTTACFQQRADPGTSTIGCDQF